MESNPHAGTGAYSCDVCGRRFPFTKHQMNEAQQARDEHPCEGHPMTVIGTLKNMLIEERLDRIKTIPWLWHQVNQVTVREDIERSLEFRLESDGKRRRASL